MARRRMQIYVIEVRDESTGTMLGYMRKGKIVGDAPTLLTSPSACHLLLDRCHERFKDPTLKFTAVRYDPVAKRVIRD